MSVRWDSDKIVAAMTGAVHAGLDAAADVIADAAVAIHGRDHGGVPSRPGDPPNVQTNNLRASIRRTRASNFHVGVGTAVDYGRYLEFGTVTIAPRPWLRRAMAVSEKDARRAFTAAFKAKLREDGLSA